MADIKFVEHVSELNPKLHDTQFADYHGHGWNFRAAQRDRHGTLLDAKGRRGPAMMIAELRKPSTCLDPHGQACIASIATMRVTITVTAISTASGPGNQIACVDCHGTRNPIRHCAPPARSSPTEPTHSVLRILTEPGGFRWREGKLYHLPGDPGQEWRFTS